MSARSARSHLSFLYDLHFAFQDSSAVAFRSRPYPEIKRTLRYLKSFGPFAFYTIRLSSGASL